MKNKKMNLTDLKVKSFITELDSTSENTVKGGYESAPAECPTGLGAYTCNTKNAECGPAPTIGC
ncbi:hypothetical protein GCM10009122_47720 [Fulvivirga kasyanovii]|uniref:pinensin family lanthipeptide n=1 Tax=Fulvivirga kasyanovii TaxID=396812 RepID=UPI0031CFCECA